MQLWCLCLDVLFVCFVVILCFGFVGCGAITDWLF